MSMEGPLFCQFNLGKYVDLTGVLIQNNKIGDLSLYQKSS